ncbi:MAG: hypothetical protein ACREID_07125, partial [Planctomycetota bacterium]
RNTARGANNFRFLENVADLPIRDLQGARDEPRMVATLRLAFERLERLGATDARYLEFAALGHSFDVRAVDWPGYFGGAARDPRPPRVVRACARPSEGRAFWAEVLAVDPDVQETFALRMSEAAFRALDEEALLRRVQEEADRRTARLEAELLAPGRFRATGERVRKFRLLLAEGMFDPARDVEVDFNGRSYRKRARPDPRVLLVEFAERFDRTFLPVAEITVP